jgi:2-iminobutanoate/2-iminopropanoate deaminase
MYPGCWVPATASCDWSTGESVPRRPRPCATSNGSLRGCGATFDDVVKINVYLIDMATFAEMNEAYLAVLGDDPPARITVGCNALALGASVEMDCVAYRPGGCAGEPVTSE